MIKKISLILLFVCSVCGTRTGFAAIGDTDSDTGTTVSTSDWISWTIEPRDDNALGLQPIVDNEGLLRFSKQDCVDEITTDISFTLAENPAGTGRTLYLLRGEDCDQLDHFDDCTDFQSKVPTSTLVALTDIPLNQMIDGLDCNSTATAKEDIWVALLKSPATLDTAGDDVDKIEKLAQVIVDFKGPSATTTINDVLIGNDSLEVKFASSTATDVRGYAMFYAAANDASCTDGPLSAGVVPVSQASVYSKVTESSDATSIKVNGLQNGKYYQVGIATLDAHGNPSALTTIHCASPAESIGIGDAINSDGEYCFIATAAFGDYNHPTVKVLRAFRDRFLKEVPGGNTLIAGYYSVGPSLAGLIEDDGEAREMVRNTLGLFAQVTRFLVAAGPMLVCIAVFAAMLLGIILGVAAPRVKEK